MERVGKKYQWIALDELLGWLSDTHWLKGEWEEFPRPYAFPTDIGFQRDVDPTLPVEADVEQAADTEWWRVKFEFPHAPNDELATWVAADDRWQDAIRAIFRTDAAGQEWITLELFQRAKEDHKDRDHIYPEISMRRETFLFVQCVIVQSDKVASSFAAVKSAKSKDGMRLSATSIVDGPFWGELGWRATWPDLGWQVVDAVPPGVLGLKPVAEFVWESHLDASLPDGLRLRVPVPLLSKGLGLRYPDPRHPRMAKNAAEQPIFVDHEAASGDDYASVVRRDAFEQFLRDQKLGCLWFVFGERSAWPDGRAEFATRRWFGRWVSFDGISTQCFEWETPWGRDG